MTIKAAPGSGVMIDGKPVGEQVLGDDLSEKTDVVTIGELSFHVIRRGDKFGIRVKDPNSPVRTQFKGLVYFAADEAWRVTGTFVPYAKPRKVDIPTVLGTVEVMEAPGIVKFTVEGKELSLEPVVEDPKGRLRTFRSERLPGSTGRSIRCPHRAGGSLVRHGRGQRNQQRAPGPTVL